jgi:hypothetical protein
MSVLNPEGRCGGQTEEQISVSLSYSRVTKPVHSGTKIDQLNMIKKETQKFNGFNGHPAYCPQKPPGKALESILSLLRHTTVPVAAIVPPMVLQPEKSC